ncbi:MAG: DUF4974 domain-containing protein [Bacteroides sp.]|nr:DUF4974 domain-containing protein [Bacteroides sp.]
MKSPFEFADRLFRYITDCSEDEERQYIKQTLTHNQKLRQLTDELQDRKQIHEVLHRWQQFNPEKAWMHIERFQYRKQQQIILRRSLVAASALLLLIGTWIGKYRETIGVVPSQATIAKIIDSSKFVRLETASGECFRLDTLEHLALSKEQSTLSNEKGLLAWVSTNVDGTSPELKYNKIVVPYTQTYRLLLPDSSRIYLNSGSTLEFPSHFTSHERRIRISGEIYCEVSHHHSWPFIVESGDISVKVLGTTFNIKAYPDEEEILTTLIDGHVIVSGPHDPSAHLHPGQQAKYSSQTSRLQISSVDSEAETAWKDGLFYFKNQTMKSILKTLSRWYDLRISCVEEEIQSTVFNGKIPMYTSVEDVLRKFEHTDRIRFELVGKELTVRRSKK